MIEQQTQILSKDQVLAHKGVTLENHFSLFHYKIGEIKENVLTQKRAKASTGEKNLELKPYEINLILMKKVKNVPTLNLNGTQGVLSPQTSNGNLNSSF